MVTGLDTKEFGEIIARYRDSLYPEAVTIDLAAADRVAQTLIVGGLLPAGTNISGLHDTVAKVACAARAAPEPSPDGLCCRVRDLSISYGDEPVLEGASVEVGQGQFVSLVGPSGSGKSSLLRAVIGLQKPLAGTVDPEVKPSEVGMLFQDDALLPWKTARDNVALGLDLPRLRAERARWCRPTTGSTASASPGSRTLSAPSQRRPDASASRSRRCWR